MMHGFTFFLNGKDYFVETSQVYKTSKLAAKILPALGLSRDEVYKNGNIQALLYRMQKATCEVRTCENTERKEKRYFEISGDGFGGRGSWVNDGETVLIRFDENDEAYIAEL